MRGAIHTLTIEHTGVTAPDSEGRHAATITDTITVKGRVIVERAKEAAPGHVGRFAEDIDAFAALPVGTAVAAKDRVVVANVDPTLDGEYEVQNVVYLPTNLEVYLRRRGV